MELLSQAENEVSLYLVPPDVFPDLFDLNIGGYLVEADVTLDKKQNLENIGFCFIHQ
ncbi:hypothetical protein D3C87_1697160 [compost metagenome]